MDPEKKLIAEYSMLLDKEQELKAEIKLNKSKIEQDISRIEAFNNILYQHEKDHVMDILKTEQNSDIIYKTAPILQPAFLDENKAKKVQPLSFMKQNPFNVEDILLNLVAFYGMPSKITMIDLTSVENCLCVGCDGILRIFSGDGVLFNWDVSIESTQNAVLSVTMIKNYLAVGMEDGFVRIFDFESKRIEYEFPASPDPIVFLKAFPNQCKYLFSGDSNGNIVVWNGPNNPRYSVSFDGTITNIEYQDDNNIVVYILTQEKVMEFYKWDAISNEIQKLEDSPEKSAKIEKGEVWCSVEFKEPFVNFTKYKGDKKLFDTAINTNINDFQVVDKNDSFICIANQNHLWLFRYDTKGNSDSTENGNFEKGQSRNVQTVYDVAREDIEVPSKSSKKVSIPLPKIGHNQQNEK